MTTELTLREKVLAVVADCEADDAQVIDRIADLLSATGAPAYIRVADDLRGVVREKDVVFEVPAEATATVVIHGGPMDYIKPYLQSSGGVVFGAILKEGGNV